MVEKLDFNALADKARAGVVVKKRNPFPYIVGAVGIVGAILFGVYVGSHPPTNFDAPLGLNETVKSADKISWNVNGEPLGERFISASGEWVKGSDKAFTNTNFEGCKLTIVKTPGDYGDHGNDVEDTARYGALFAENAVGDTVEGSVWVPTEKNEKGIEFSTLRFNQAGESVYTAFRHMPKSETLLLVKVGCDTDAQLDKLDVGSNDDVINRLGLRLNTQVAN